MRLSDEPNRLHETLGGPGRVPPGLDVEFDMLDPIWVFKPQELADALQISRATLFRDLSSGLFLDPLRLGRCPRWLRWEVRAWLEAGAPSQEIWATLRASRGFLLAPAAPARPSRATRRPDTI